MTDPVQDRPVQDRGAAMAAFLEANGWGAGDCRPLAGDASFRHYHRLARGERRAVLMDAPPPLEDIRPFMAVAAHLLDFGYSAPRLLAADAEAGFLLLEDFGDALYSRLLPAGDDGPDERRLYEAAVDLLADLHRRAAPADLPRYSDDLLMAETDLLADWYWPAAKGGEMAAGLRDDYRVLWRDLFGKVRTGADVMVLRDYHADNLLWLPDRAGHARVGLLDFQDALVGPAAYDLVSLLEDARRDVDPLLAEEMLARYIAARGVEEEAFRTAYAILGAHRNARIIGVFTRLWRRDGKARYLDFLPRVWGLLERDLAHPALAPLRAWFDHHLPRDERCKKLPGASA